MDITRWTRPLDETMIAFRQSFGSMTPSELNWKPTPQTWSVGQNIDHLIVINESYYPVIQSIRNGTYQLPFHGRIGFLVSVLGKLLLQSVQPDRKRKMKTFPIWEPSASEIPAGILDKFELHQNKLKSLIKECADLLDQGTVISSPANKNIVYRLETAFDILVAHEKRHFVQANEVAVIKNKQ